MNKDQVEEASDEEIVLVAEEGEEVVDEDVAEGEVEAGAVVVDVEDVLMIGLQLLNLVDWSEKAKSNN